MAYWRLYCHIVWAVKGRASLIKPEMEDAVYRIIGHKCSDQGGFAYAVNGIEDHVHVVAAVPPTIALSDFVKGLKGSSSRFIHTEYQTPFAWQSGYGIFTVSERNLATAIQYVRHQKEHHKAGTLVACLERFTSEDDGPRLELDD
ncbi:MAG: IS200/IS605 family transposase [Anaerolineae bacterium]|nr:IS200/IS605 family transposase [Anaerolineae bacterium]